MIICYLILIYSGERLPRFSGAESSQHIQEDGRQLRWGNVLVPGSHFIRGSSHEWNQTGVKREVVIVNEGAKAEIVLINL